MRSSPTVVNVTCWRSSRSSRSMGCWRFGPTRIRELARLPADRRRQLIAALWLLWLVRVGLWTVPFRRLRALLARLERDAGPRRDNATADDLAWCVTAASRYVPAATC